jgi:hypothetical protein
VKIVSTDRATLKGDAKVSAVLDQVTPGSTNFVVKAVLPNPNDQFRSGMVVTGLVSRPTTSGVRIPRTAFNDDTQSTVQTIVKGTPPAGASAAATPPADAQPGASPAPRGPRPGVIKTIPVTMVAEDGNNAVVQGLSPGQIVVLNGQLGLSDGQPAIACQGDACKDPANRSGRKVAER